MLELPMCVWLYNIVFGAYMYIFAWKCLYHACWTILIFLLQRLWGVCYPKISHGGPWCIKYGNVSNDDILPMLSHDVYIVNGCSGGKIHPMIVGSF